MNVVTGSFNTNKSTLVVTFKYMNGMLILAVPSGKTSLPFSFSVRPSVGFILHFWPNLAQYALYWCSDIT